MQHCIFISVSVYTNRDSNMGSRDKTLPSHVFACSPQCPNPHHEGINPPLDDILNQSYDEGLRLYLSPPCTGFRGHLHRMHGGRFHHCCETHDGREHCRTAGNSSLFNVSRGQFGQAHKHSLPIIIHCQVTSKY